jgi:acetyl-CoA carboxylase biotin carboxylase subunit
MFKRLLIANRGEVAVRVMRTAQRMGIEVVALTTPDERELEWLKSADEVVCLGSSKSYLNQDEILEVARMTRCSAIHPGWGFLSENSTFATRCQAAGFTFVGPRPALVRRMGDKVQARETMSALGLGPIPGSEGSVKTPAHAREWARRIGYPVLLKAASGGGGRGMRKVYEESQLEQAFSSATSESEASFGDGTLYMEKLIEGGRHIEFQVVGDNWGRVMVLGERECSIQRRHQKLLEETPSPAVSEEYRVEVSNKIANALTKAGYTSAGTVEMLRDPAGNLYFMELNTRLQVEHPVTEMVCGLDLVELQLRVAANEPLNIEAVKPSGHAIEVRINAEDPDRDYAPTPGKVTKLTLPSGEGIRVETYLSEGDTISPHFDSMIAKVIAHGKSRKEAIERLENALSNMVVEGVSTTIALQKKILASESFRAGDYNTSTLEGGL